VIHVHSLALESNYRSSDFFPSRHFFLYFFPSGKLVLDDLDLSRFFHIYMLADVLLDEKLLLHFLLLSDHLMILLFVSQHILFVAYVVFLQ
jgi:hypothetical protein